jgi:hypothetical protein
MLMEKCFAIRSTMLTSCTMVVSPRSVRGRLLPHGGRSSEGVNHHDTATAMLSCCSVRRKHFRYSSIPTSDFTCCFTD